MAELEDAPWATKKADAITVRPAAPEEDLPDAPWATAEPAPGVGEDIAKATIPSLERGGIGLLTSPRTISDLAGAATNYVANKLPQGVADAANRFHNWDSGVGNVFPSYDKVKGAVERDLTGPMYDAKTGPGHLYQKTLEIAPSLLAGGEGVIPSIGKAVGSAAGSETLKKGAEALKGHFPNSMPNWLVPAAEAVGGMLGTAAPATARRAVTLLPVTDARLAEINAAKAVDPNFVKSATAGQVTNSPRTMSLEGRRIDPEAQAAKQTRAFTAATEKLGSDTGSRIGQIYQLNEINPTEFPRLNQEIQTARQGFANIAGAKNAGSLKELEDEIRLGAQNSPRNASMRGLRYQYMRDRLQGDIDASSNVTEKNALINMKTSLDDAFNRSIGPSQAATLKALKGDKQVHEALAQRTPTLDQTMSPQQVLEAATASEGRKRVNANQGTLAPWARNANTFMEKLPPPNNTVPPSVDLGVSAILGALQGGAAHAHGPGGLAGGMLTGLAGSEGSVFGHLIAPSLYKGTKDLVARAVASRPGQALLKNQLWRPGPNSLPPDKAALLRVLAAPPEGPRMLNNGGGS